MADTVKKLASAKPAAGVLADLTAVPAAKGWIISTVVINCQSGTDDGYAVEHAVAGAATADSAYIFGSGTRYHPIGADSMWGMTLGITLNATDLLRVRSTNGTCTFTFYGTERDQ